MEFFKEEEAGTPQLSVLAAPRTSSLWDPFQSRLSGGMDYAQAVLSV